MPLRRIAPLHALARSAPPPYRRAVPLHVLARSAPPPYRRAVPLHVLARSAPPPHRRTARPSLVTAPRGADRCEPLAERRLGLAGLVEPEVLAAGGHVLLVVDAAWMVVRVLVADASAERPRGRVCRRAQRRRRSRRARLADVGPRGTERLAGRVGLRREREIDRRLGERERRLGQADVLDGVRGRDRDLQRLRVRIPDVLGRQDHHPPCDEARVLAALEHRRQVVERGVGIRPARGLDPGRDVVVVLVAGLVVAQRLALHRVLGVGQRDVLARALGRVERELPSAFSDERASPPERAARNSTTSSETLRPSSFSARRSSPAMSSAVSSCSS